MLSKFGFVTVGVGLAMFAMGPIRSLATHRGLSESAVWAQESQESQDSEDQAGDSVSADDLAAQAAAAAQDDPDYPNIKSGPASGIYEGTVMDNNMGMGTISAALTQLKSKLSGVWQDTFVPPAFWKGSIKSGGAISAKMKFHIRANAVISFTGLSKTATKFPAAIR